MISCFKPKGVRICTAPSRCRLCTQPCRRQYIYQHHKIMLLSQALDLHVSYNSHNNYPLLFSTCLTELSLFVEGIMFFERYDLKLNLGFRRLVAGVLPRRPGFDPGLAHVMFALKKCHWDRFFSLHFSFTFLVCGPG